MHILIPQKLTYTSCRESTVFVLQIGNQAASGMIEHMPAVF